SSRGWTRGRYTLTVEVQPIDGTTANVAVNAKVEGRTDGATGAEWSTLRSTGLVEDEFLNALVPAVTGASPPGRNPYLRVSNLKVIRKACVRVPEECRR